MEVLIVVLLLVVIGLILYFYSKQKQVSNLEFNEQELVSQIVLKLSQMQNSNLGQIFDSLNNTSNKQSKELADNQLKLEQRLNTMQSDIAIKLNKGLEDSQNILQNRLQSGITHLSEINKKELEKLQLSTTNSLDILTKTNQESLSQINQDVQKKLDENFARNLESFKQVSHNLGQIQSTAQKMIESTKSVDKLNTIFSRTSSKAFGGFAENYLESLLTENLSKDSWDKQVKVPNSTEVIDFVIYVDDRKIGIDAKFPLTKYQDYIESDLEQKENRRKEFLKTVMDMAKSISHKYYKNNFVDALFLYLPSESLYNEVLDTTKNQKIMEFLNKQKVSLISPNTIFPQIMLISSYQFRLQVSQNAENIVLGLKQIQKNIELSQEETWSDQSKSKKLNQKLKSLNKKKEEITQLIGLIQDLKASIELGDRDESLILLQKIQTLFQDQKNQKYLNGKFDHQNVVLSIHAGAGGLDAQDWSTMLLEMYQKFSLNQGWSWELVAISVGDEGGIKSASVSVEGENVYAYLKEEAGVHRLIRLSPFNSGKTRETSFSLIEVIPANLDEFVSIDRIPEKDLRWDYFMSSGKGGQGVNTTYSAVRVVHIPTGISSTCQNERNQHQNKATALKQLTNKLLAIQIKQQQEFRDEIKGEFLSPQWGSQIRSYTLHPYKLVKDHRSGFETNNVDEVLQGGKLLPFIWSVKQAQI